MGDRKLSIVKNGFGWELHEYGYEFFSLILSSVILGTNENEGPCFKLIFKSASNTTWQ